MEQTMENMDKYIGKMLDNRYEILEQIGVGGMAVVYKALCHRLNRFVAVKILKDDYAVDEDFRRRFHTEAQAVAMLSHPNIVTVYDVSRTTDVNYIVMELIEGITLKQYMQKRGVLSWKEALHFAMQISKALMHAHSRGIVHRDIKPHNIMILRDGSVKVADFGIARLTTSQNTLTQETLGSVHYISPEQAKGSQTDARTDIYSLGVVMYEMLTGRLPFEGDSAVAVAIQHISSIPLMPREINPDIPEGLEQITMRAMCAELDKRYQSAEELYADLESFRKNPEGNFDERELPFTDTPPAPPPETVRRTDAVRRRKNGTRVLTQETEGVRPVRGVRELSRKEYRKNTMRARSVTILLGVLFVILFVLLLFMFLWKNWFKPMFTEPETMTVPALVGSKLDNVLKNPGYTDNFNIIPTYEANEGVEEGFILSQSPASGRTVIKGEEKATVKVVVSSGSEVVLMPDLVNKEYRNAFLTLQKMRLEVEEDLVISEEVTEGYVISTSPAAGEQLRPGDKVFITVSSGPEIKYVTMPDLYGKTAQAAAARIEAMNLTVGFITEVEDDAEKGTVIFQSTAPGTSIPEHTKINLNISSGPVETAPPETEPPEGPTGEPGDETGGEGGEGGETGGETGGEGGGEENVPPETGGEEEENGGAD
jgi:serine/threonine-protein kinase